MPWDVSRGQPVSDYGEALRWLITFSRVEDWAYVPDASLPAEAQLVCDMHWVTPSKICADLRHMLDTALRPPRNGETAFSRRWGRRYGL